MTCLDSAATDRLPIGNLTPSFWANVYLNPLDQFIKRELELPGLYRYVDDFARLFARTSPASRLEVRRD